MLITIKNRRKLTAIAYNSFLWGVVTFLCCFALMPYVMLFLGALLPDSLTDNGIGSRYLLEGKWTLKNHYNFFQGDYKRYSRLFFNTLVVSMCATCIVLTCSILGALGLTRLRSRYAESLEAALLLAYLFPPVALVFPYADILRMVDLNGSVFGLVLINAAFCLPFGFWLMARFARAIPFDYDRAAAADGADWWQTVLYVLLPRLSPGVVAVGIFCFVLCWNDVVFSLVLGTSETRTLAAGVKEAILDTEVRSSYSSFAAASLWVAVPLAFIFAVLQSWADDRFLRESGEHS
jgi:multiple sugar transport system permease protein